MATDRKAEVTWQGDLMNGSGTIGEVSIRALREVLALEGREDRRDAERVEIMA